MPERERAVTSVLNYVLLLGVVAILVSVIIVSASSFVDGQREETVRSELTVQGNRLAADLSTADTLAASGDVRLRSALPERAARRGYRVSIQSASPANTYRLVLESRNPSVTVTVRVRTEHPVETGSHSGGDLWISYDAATGRLEVADD